MTHEKNQQPEPQVSELNAEYNSEARARRELAPRENQAEWRQPWRWAPVAIKPKPPTVE